MKKIIAEVRRQQTKQPFQKIKRNSNQRGKSSTGISQRNVEAEPTTIKRLLQTTALDRIKRQRSTEKPSKLRTEAKLEPIT